MDKLPSWSNEAWIKSVSKDDFIVWGQRNTSFNDADLAEIYDSAVPPKKDKVPPRVIAPPVDTPDLLDKPDAE